MEEFGVEGAEDSGFHGLSISDSGLLEPLGESRLHWPESPDIKGLALEFEFLSLYLGWGAILSF